MKAMRTGWYLLFLSIMALASGLSRPGITSAEDTRNPHGRFKQDCNLCHSPKSWVPARISSKFDHSKYGLVLQGAHRETPCLSCHASLDFSKEQSACVDCHQDVHEGELGPDCARCHTTRTFIERSRMEKMHQLTRFPLTGVHATLDCRTCHDSTQPGNLTWVNLGSECVACHRAAALSAVPDHQDNAFPEDCGQCHRTTSWIPAAFGHDGTSFPLTGAHRSLSCAACHGEGQFGKVGSACVDCHRDDYDGTLDPVHTTIGFPLECQRCHNTTTWQGASFDHTRFPIDSGTHAGKWTLCSDCHKTPGNYLDFTCLSCHPHSDEAKTQEGHKEVPNYIYESSACYTCHPQGRH